MGRHRKTPPGPLLVAAAALAGALATPPVLAQHGHRDDAGPDPIVAAYRAVAAIGRDWNAAAFAETARRYTAVHRGVEWPGIRDAETFSYGSDPLQTLRVFVPEQGFSEPGPVFVFLHGNGLTDSDQLVAGSDDLLYGNVGRLGARFGGIGVTANYRRRNAQRDGAEDVAAIIGWITEHIAAYGGDPETIVLLANSDGARHALLYLVDRSLQPDDGPGLAAAILSSGTFDESLPQLAALIEGYDGPRVPLALWTAQYDPARVETSVAEVFVRLCRKYQDCPAFAQLAGHNHVSHVMSLGTDDVSVQSELIRFYHTVR